MRQRMIPILAPVTRIPPNPGVVRRSGMHPFPTYIEAILSWFYGCSHRRKAFPITIGSETYVVCLSCGRRFAYDWENMRAGKRPMPLATATVAIAVLLLTGAGVDAQQRIPLNAVVSDPRCTFVSGLQAEDFEPYDDGVRQTLRLYWHDDVPVRVGLAVDHGDSIPSKLTDISPDDEMFVINFNEKVAMGLPPGISFTVYVHAQSRWQAGSREKRTLLAISDRHDNATVRSQAEVLKLVRQVSTLPYSIGIFDAEDLDGNPAVACFPRQCEEAVAMCGSTKAKLLARTSAGYIAAGEAAI